MALPRLVIDTNVILQIEFNREFKDKCVQLIQSAALGEVELYVPTVFLDEYHKVLAHKIQDLKELDQRWKKSSKLIESGILHVVTPTPEMRCLAAQITRRGHKKSGYPSYVDALFHALALCSEAQFLTNDQKYYAKVQPLGQIIYLPDYSPAVFLT